MPLILVQRLKTKTITRLDGTGRLTTTEAPESALASPETISDTLINLDWIESVYSNPVGADGRQTCTVLFANSPGVVILGTLDQFPCQYSDTPKLVPNPTE